jgi:hypothetical protein
MDTLFIQFYGKDGVDHDEYTYGYEIQNGFSDTYDFCKNMGDFYWSYHNIGVLQYIKMTNEVGVEDLPINKGTVYICAAYWSHLYKAWLWAKKYPDIKFVVGGPMLTTDLFSIREKLPKNLHLIRTSVEEYFKIPMFGHPWKLDIPPDVPDDACIMFVYTIDDSCYWGKCIFCAYSTCKNHVRRRRRMDYEFQSIEHNGPMVIRLGTESYTADMLKTLTPPEMEQVRYRTFLRFSKHELNALKTLKEFPISWFSTGFEYPSTRMWKYMNKGYNRQDILDTTKFLLDNGIYVTPAIILGWTNLIESDLDELEEFMSELPSSKYLQWLSLNRLSAIHNTELYKTSDIGMEFQFGPFYYGYFPKLTEKQLDLNIRSQEIVLKYTEQKNIKVAKSPELSWLDYSVLQGE